MTNQLLLLSWYERTLRAAPYKKYLVKNHVFFIGLDNHNLDNKYPEMVRETQVALIEALCRKDTGKQATLRKLSRGHQLVVKGGGHIDTWQPLNQ